MKKKDQNRTEKKTGKKRKMGLLRLRTKLNLMFILLALILGILMFYSTRLIIYITVTKVNWDKAQGAAYIAANYLQTGEFQESAEAMEPDEVYEHVRQRLTMFKQSLGIHDLIVLKPEQTGAVVYIALQDDPDAVLENGDFIQYSDEEREKLLPEIEQGIAPEYAVTSHSGHGDREEIGAWVPLKNHDGDVVAIVEADILTEDILGVALFWMIFTGLVYVLIVLFSFLGYQFLTNWMIFKPLKKITIRASSFVEGDQLAGFENDIKSGDELQVLNEALSKMSQDIAAYTARKEQIAANDQRAATELQVAAGMQNGMIPTLPEEFLQRYDYWLGSRFIPSPQVGGSSFDHFALDGSRMAIVMCSMEAAGLAAAVQLLVARTIIRSQLIGRDSLREAMAEINYQLYEQLPQHDVPLRVFVGVLDGESHRLTCINADNNAPLLMCRGQTYRFLPCPVYAPMGQVENVAYQEHTLELQQGDRLLWYSDGVLDSLDESGAPLGADGLKNLLGNDRSSDPEELLDKLKQLNGKEEKERVLLLLECRRVNQKRSSLRVEPRPENAEQVKAFVRKRLENQPLSGRARAQLLICAEEYFSVCCRYVQRGSVEVSCAPEDTRFVLRFTADMNGLDPFEHDAGETMRNTIEFIRKYTDEAAARVVKGCTTLTMTKSLMDVSTEG